MMGNLSDSGIKPRRLAGGCDAREAFGGREKMTCSGKKRPSNTKRFSYFLSLNVVPQSCGLFSDFRGTEGLCPR
jgi:hypothetical protein